MFESLEQHTHDAAVEEDEQTQEYVQMLEQEYDRRNDTAIPTADDIGAAFERFLREQEDE